MVMDKYVLKFKPILYPKIWGGTRLLDFLDIHEKGENIGEAWIIAAHPNGDSIVSGGYYDGRKLSELFKNETELFGEGHPEKFPLLVKFIDAKESLSIQVHPDDLFANKVGEPYGKEEVWFVMNAGGEKKVQLGHNAKTRSEFIALINAKKWDELLRYRAVDNYDLVPVLPGTLHAILKDTFVLEIQQSSDTTYRVYDYDRVTATNEKRELHLDEAFQVTKIPDDTDGIVKYQPNISTTKKLWEGNHFLLEYWQTKAETIIKKSQQNYILLTIIAGNGTINGVPVVRGEGIIITKPVQEITVSSGLEIMAIYPK